MAKIVMDKDLQELWNQYLTHQELANFYRRLWDDHSALKREQLIKDRVK